MHRVKVLLVILSLYAGAAKAQSVQEVFTRNTMTWYGLDFSQAKFVGNFNQFAEAGQVNASKLRNTYFKSWNSVILNEKDKYNLAKFYKKDSIGYNVTPVETLNERTDTTKMMQVAVPKALTAAQIQAAVQKYRANGNRGLGLVFIVEAFDKSLDKGIIHLTFFDIASRKVLLTKRLETKPAGFGLRNYWVSTAYAVMKQSDKNWKNWQQEAGAH